MILHSHLALSKPLVFFPRNYIKSTISYPITAVASHETTQPSNVTPLTAVEMNNPPPPPYPTLPDVTTTQQSHQQQQVVCI